MTHRIAIFGTGNVAYHLAKRMSQAGLDLAYIVSRSEESGKQLVESLNLAAKPVVVQNVDQMVADILVLAVPDGVLPEFLSEVALPKNSILLHTSGAQPMNCLATHSRHGVLYPFQTFTKAKAVNWQQLPVFIEGNSEAVTKVVATLAGKLTADVRVLSSEERLRVHLAAVFANNFANHLFAIADELLANSAVRLRDFQHLIQETLDKAMTMPPADAQTGPAIRGDAETMEKHLEVLKDQPELAQLYQQLSTLIAKGKKS